MALLFCDGFDHYATADLLKKWRSGTAATAGIVTSGGRRNGGYVNLQNTGSTAMLLSVSNLATVICGFGFNPASAGTAAILHFLDSTTTQCTLFYNIGGSLSVYRGNGTTLLGSSAGGIVPTAAWCYIEVKIAIHNTAGTVEVRVNGNTTPVINLTSQNTRSTSNNFANGIAPVAVGAFSPTWFDDFYVCDTSGSLNNDFMGDVRVDTLLPNGDGNYSQFTCSTGSTHSTLVDETTPNTTDYVSSSTVSQKDSYTMGNLANTSTTVKGIQVCNAILKDDAGARSAANLIRSSSTDAQGTSTALSTSQSYLLSIHETDPATSAAWAATAVNAMEAGTIVTV